jgi:arylsulfatase
MSRPNVLLITTDQHRADCVGAYGNPVIRTPNLDALAADGVRFDRAYVPNPVCTPSRSSILTGRFPRAHGAWNVGVTLPETEIGLSHVLAAEGYRTAILGKAHFGPFGGPPEPGNYDNRKLWAENPDLDWNGPYYGFETARLALAHGVAAGHYAQHLRRAAPKVLDRFGPENALAPPTGAHESWKSAVPVEHHAATWVADITIDYLEQSGDEPFFVWASFPEPHHPFSPPAPYCDMYDPAEVPLPPRRTGELDDKPPHFDAYYRRQLDRIDYRGDWMLGLSGLADADLSAMPEAHLREIVAHYYGMVTLVDDQVGRILAALERLGQRENTIVVFTADHGELLGEHGLLLKGPFHYEGLVRVPLIWSWPAGLGGGRATGGLANLVDLAPTLLDMVGVAPPPGVQGRSLLPVLRGETERVQDATLVENCEKPGVLNVKTLVTEEWKLTYYGGKPFGELYDLRGDPDEHVNLWDRPEHAATRGELTRRLLDLLIDTEDPLPPRRAYA